MKRLFLLLLVLNLGVFLWLYPQWSEQRRTSGVLEPEVGKLRLLSEIKEVGALRPKAGNDSGANLAQTTGQEPQLAQEMELAAASQTAQAQGQRQEQLPGQEQEYATIAEAESAPEQAMMPDPEQVEQAVPAERLEPEAVDSSEVAPATEPEQDLVQASVAGSEQAPLPELGLVQKPEGEGITAPESEVAEAQPDAPIILKQPAVPVVSVECYRLGAIEQRAQAARLVQRLKPLGVESAIQEEIVQKEAGHWVIHPPLATTELAQAKEREFKAAGIKDIWRIREGDMKDAISLGLFFEKKNAENMKRQLEGKGFKPEIRLRQVEQPVYWVGLRASTDAAPLERIKDALQGQKPALEMKAVPCPDVVSP